MVDVYPSDYKKFEGVWTTSLGIVYQFDFPIVRVGQSSGVKSYDPALKRITWKMNITEKKENHPHPLSRQNHILKVLSKAKRQKENIFLFKKMFFLFR